MSTTQSIDQTRMSLLVRLRENEPDQRAGGEFVAAYGKLIYRTTALVVSPRICGRSLGTHGAILRKSALRIRTEILISTRKWCEEIPPELDLIVMRCLAKSPADRFKNGKELAISLEICAARSTKGCGHRIAMAGGVVLIGWILLRWFLT